ncbi:reverse transcriptase domain-containing protein, partial [Tanacetum coccineum]
MITEAEIGGHFIHRIYVDGGLASEILYEYCFNRLRPEVKNQMVPATTPLIGFSGEIIWLMGQIFLQVKIEDAEHSTSTWMNFVVVRSPSQYNGIIGRPRVRKIQAVPSTAHEMLKFPVLGGILTLRSSKIIPLECTMVSKLEAQPSSITQATEERIRVAIHPKYPEQTIAIGFTLTEGSATPSGTSPKRPRRMTSSQTKEKKPSTRNEQGKIQVEVEKLVDAKIMKEVHDDSWRMCVDFKDLNKIRIVKEDEEKTAFITSQGIFCYSKMPFGLKNARETYQRFADKAFQKQIGRNLEVYVDDLVIKSRTEQEIMEDIEETFKTLRVINMKLNPKKCTFGVEEGTFLGYK